MEHTLKLFSFFFVLIKILEVVAMGRSDSGDSKIQNGVPVPIEKWPYLGSYQIVLFGYTLHQCMTSLITPRLAMTAAHCIVRDLCIDPREMSNFGEKEDNLVEAYVLMGADTPELPVGDYQKIRIIRAFIHEYFYTAPVPYASQYDIAVVKVRYSFSLNSRVALARLYPNHDSDSNPVYAGLSSCKMAGWGHTDYNGSDVEAWNERPGILRGSLREIDVKLITIDECCDKYIVHDFNVAHEHCIGNFTAIGHSCFERIHPGDSGAHGDSGTAIECVFNNEKGSPRVVVGTYVGGPDTVDPLMTYRVIDLPMYRTTIKTMVEFAERMKRGGVPPPPGQTDPPDVIPPSTKFRRYTKIPPTTKFRRYTALPTTKFKRFTDELKK